MKKAINLSIINASKLNTNHVRLMWFLVTLLLFAIGAGAPEGTSGWDGG